MQAVSNLTRDSGYGARASVQLSAVVLTQPRSGWAAAGSVDTDLSFLSFLELYRTHVAQRRMAPGRVVEPLDVIEDVSTSLLPGPVYLPSRSLCLQ